MIRVRIDRVRNRITNRVSFGLPGQISGTTHRIGDQRSHVAWKEL